VAQAPLCLDDAVVCRGVNAGDPGKSPKGLSIADGLLGNRRLGRPGNRRDFEILLQPVKVRHPARPTWWRLLCHRGPLFVAGGMTTM